MPPSLNLTLNYLKNNIVLIEFIHIHIIKNCNIFYNKLMISILKFIIDCNKY